MKARPKPVSLRKAIGIVMMGFACGFCAVAAFLGYSDSHGVTAKVVAWVAGSVLAMAAAFLFNRLR